MITLIVLGSVGGWLLWLFRPEMLLNSIQLGASIFVISLFWRHINVQRGALAIILDSENNPKRVVFGGRHIIFPFFESILTIGNTSDAAVWNPCKREITFQDQTVTGLPFKCDLRVDVTPFDILNLVNEEIARGNPNFPYICSYSSPEYFLDSLSRQCASQFVQMGLEEFVSNFKDRMEEDRSLVKSNLLRKFQGIQGSWLPNGGLRFKPSYKPYWKWFNISSFSITHLEWDRNLGHSPSSKPETGSVLKAYNELIKLVGNEESLTSEQRIALLNTATRMGA